MPGSINVVAHNLQSMFSNRQLGITELNKAKSAEKLASGYKINRAADDAAGLAISEKMRRQIRGLKQGTDNTQDGISLCQVADSALSEVSEMLHRITELSVQASNDTNDKDDRQAIQAEINQILKEVDRVSDTTTFNEKKIFSDKKIEEEEPIEEVLEELTYDLAFEQLEKGTMRQVVSDITLSNGQVLSAQDANNFIKMCSNALITSELGELRIGGYPTNYGNYYNKLPEVAPIIYANMDGIEVYADDSVGYKEKIDNVASIMLTGRDYFEASKNGAFPTGYIGGNLALYSDRIPAINYATLGVSYFSMCYGKHNLETYTGTLIIKDTDGYHCGREASYYFASAAQRIISSAGINGSTTDEWIKKLDLRDGHEGDSYLDPDGYYAWSTLSCAEKYDSLTRAYMSLFELRNGQDEEPVEEEKTTKWWIQSGCEPDDGMYLEFGYMDTDVLGISEVSVLTGDKARETISRTKNALGIVSEIRSDIGAQQNRLEHTVKRQENTVENTTAAESRIRDTDMASEMVKYSNNSILCQAGQSILAQANQSNQGVISLLQ